MYHMGLGATGVVNPATGVINCSALVPGAEATTCGNCSSYFDWIVTPECWSMSPAAWEQAAQYPAPSTPAHVPAIASAYGTGPSSVDDAQAQIDAAIAAQTQAKTQQNLSFFGSIVPVGSGSGGSGSGTCTSTLFSSLGICDSTVYWGFGIAAFVLLFAVSAKGKRR